jgi:hypothetical protein
MLALKIRCGGDKPSDTPSTDAVADFLSACARADIPFKATAGLHHPIRFFHPGVGDKPSHCRHSEAISLDSAGFMHGFLNVFLAAFLIRRAYGVATQRQHEDGRVSAPEIALELLSDTEASNFQIAESAIMWRNLRFGIDEVAAARAEFALSIGSCSIAEPVADLQSLGWLSPNQH